MKNILILLVMLAVSVISVGQPPGDPDLERREKNKEAAKYKDKNDKIKALAIAYITEQLDMSSQEAEQFWPVYNRIKEDHRKLELKKRKILKELGDSFQNLQEAQAQDYVDQLIQLEEQLHESSLEMKHQELIDIIGARRFLMLKKAEMDFRRKMIREFKERRRNKN
jgi:hypothetical protein